MSLLRDTLRHTIIYSAGSMLGRLIGFIMLPFYAHAFEAEGYGILSMIDASLGLLVVAFSGGFTSAILRIYHEEGPAHGGRVVGSGMILTGVLAAIAIAVPLVFRESIADLLLGDARHSGLLALALCSFAIDVVGQSASVYLVLAQRSIAYSAVNLVRLISSVSLNIWLVFGLSLGLTGVFVSTLISATLSTTMFAVLAARNMRLTFDAKIARKLRDYQLPMLPGDLIAFASRQIERYLVRFLIDIKAAGVLEMAYKFPPLLNMLITLPFLKAWNTKALELATNAADAPHVIGAMFTRYFASMTCVGVLLAIAIDDVLRILTPPVFWPAAAIARVEIVTTILSGSTSLLLFGLIYKKRTGIISFLRAAAAIVKVPLSVLMISSFQLRGAAYAALVIEIASTACILYASQRSFWVRYEYWKLVLIACYGLLVYAAISLANVAQRVDVTGIGIGTTISGIVQFTLSALDISGARAARVATIVATRQHSIDQLAVDVALAICMFGAAIFLTRALRLHVQRRR